MSETLKNTHKVVPFLAKLRLESSIVNWGFWDILFLKHKTQKPTFKKDKNFKFKKLTP